MAMYKGIDKSETSLNEIEVYGTLSLDSSSIGIDSIQFRSGSLQGNETTPTVSGSYWNSLQVTYYLSSSNYAASESRFGFSGHSFGIYNDKNPQHKNKFHSSGSVIFVPQHYFGERIKRKTFILESGGVTLKDDGHGNLYSTTTTHTSSATTSISSSDNYKGNIFYDQGIVTITDTGSYGGVTYSHLTTGSFTLQIDSTHTIFVKEYTITVNPREFNSTSNPTARALTSGSEQSGFSLSDSPYLKNRLTGSGWSPYMTTIGFYSENEHRPVMVARFPQPIKMRDDMKLIFKIRMDY